MCASLFSLHSELHSRYKQLSILDVFFVLEGFMILQSVLFMVSDSDNDK